MPDSDAVIKIKTTLRAPMALKKLLQSLSAGVPKKAANP